MRENYEYEWISVIFSCGIKFENVDKLARISISIYSVEGVVSCGRNFCKVQISDND